MKRYLLAIAFIIGSFSACDLTDDSPCGERLTYDLYLLGSSIVDSTTGLYYSYMEGTNRVFQWSSFVEHVCPDEHVKNECRVALLDETTTGISARARNSWLFFFEETCNLTKTGSDLKCSFEAGLKQAFDKDEASFVPVLEVYFPTKGSYSSDTAHLKQNVISVEMMAKYRKF